MEDPPESQLFLLPLFLLVFIPLLPLPLLAAPSPAAPTEETVARVRQELEVFDRGLTLRESRLLKETPPSGKVRLEPHLRPLFEERERLKGDLLDGERVLRLKEDLLALHHDATHSSRRQAEAESIARTAIAAFGELRGKFRMVRPPFWHNVLVNVRLKKEGFCWQWTRDLRERLRKLSFKEFELHWATAHEGTLREHNTLVVTVSGRGIEDGLLLDGWRRSGEPFWIRVAADRYPWRPGALTGEAPP